jgi:hypothetical protein
VCHDDDEGAGWLAGWLSVIEWELIYPLVNFVLRQLLGQLLRETIVMRCARWLQHLTRSFVVGRPGLDPGILGLKNLQSVAWCQSGHVSRLF